MLTASLALLGAPVTESADWAIKKLQFSAISIGVAFSDDKTGYSSFTNGAGPIQIIKTVNGGANWTSPKNQSGGLMIMGMDVSTDPSLDVVSTGMASTEYSVDGDVFKKSFGGPFISQSIKASANGMVVTAKDSGVCISKNKGATYSCHNVPEGVLKTAGRYAAMPSPDVIYLTAGEWPSSRSNATRAGEVVEHQLSSQLRVTRRVLGLGETGGARYAIETGAAPPAPPATSGYKAQLLKSTDGGKTWKELFYDEGTFYFNQIDCFDETTCVAVGEGFGQDGSKAPGAYVHMTTDGEKFNVTHHEAVDGASLMAATMLSKTEHMAGGRLGQGVSLHSTDGGNTYTPLGLKIRGQQITDMSFISPTHAFATAVNSLQICSLLEFGSA
jgi:hypothetical protein